MAASVRLEARQAQTLTMTPQLAQSIKLLQMSGTELLRHVEQEIEKNPLLEFTSETPGEAIEPAVLNTEPNDPLAVGLELDTDIGALEAKLDTSLDNVFDGDQPPVSAAAGNGRSGSGDQSISGGLPQIAGSGVSPFDLEAITPSNTTLREHLGQQLALTRTSPAVRLIAAEIIDWLDPDGYLRRDLEEFAGDLAARRKEVAEALRLVQSMDPVGIGARNLAECLELQLRHRNRFDPAMADLIANLDLLAKRDFEALMRICRLDLEDILEMVNEIRALDPRPASQFDRTEAQAIVADVIVNERPDGSFAIELNPAAMPKVLVNQTYCAIVQSGSTDDAGRAYVAERLQEANWLVRSLEQRAQTILKTMTEIVRQQDAFFAHGVSHLKPMSLKQVADAISMHESTISRVTSNKYVLTSRGLFELKYFFTAAIGCADGSDAHSAEAVRQRIRQLIADESAENVLSDDAIVTMLRGENIDIARRTVAKYRESLNIASSVQRRREKKAALILT